VSTRSPMVRLILVLVVIFMVMGLIVSSLPPPAS
jgi:biopolymer transport protein ExbD